MNQTQDSDWYVERSKRIASSLFGRIINRRKSVFPQSLIQAVTSKTKSFVSNMSVSLKWGLDNEDRSKKQYKENFADKNSEIQNCGFIVSPKWPWLGCSPDGILTKDGIPEGCIEIKCPYSKRECSIEEAAQDKSFYLKNTENGLKLKQIHVYY